MVANAMTSGIQLLLQFALNVLHTSSLPNKKPHPHPSHHQNQGATGPNHAAECHIFARLPDEEKPINLIREYSKREKKEEDDKDGDADLLPPMPAYSSVIPLRILHLRKANPDLWDRVDLLMDHVADMSEEEKEMWQIVTADFIRETCGHEEFSSSEILRAVGIFLTNGVNQGQGRGINSQGLYPTFSFVSHSCVCNSRFQVHADRSLVLRAQLDIARGEEITVRYLPAMMGSNRRRLRIHKNWHFDCCCQRCKDPTELGTYVGATLCAKCHNLASDDVEGKAELLDYVKEHLPEKLDALMRQDAETLNSEKQQNSCGNVGTNIVEINGQKEGLTGIMIPRDPLEHFGEYRCDTCGETLGGLTVYALTQGMERESEQFRPETEEQVQDRLDALLKVLHPNHYLVLKHKKMLLDLMIIHDRERPPPDQTPKDQRQRLEKTVNLCQDLLRVVQVLEPGLSLNRGRLLRQMHLPRLSLAKTKVKSGEMDKIGFLLETKKAVLDMKLAVRCLEDFGGELDNKEETTTSNGDPMF